MSFRVYPTQRTVHRWCVVMDARNGKLWRKLFASTTHPLRQIRGDTVVYFRTRERAWKFIVNAAALLAATTHKPCFQVQPFPVAPEGPYTKEPNR